LVLVAVLAVGLAGIVLGHRLSSGFGAEAAVEQSPSAKSGHSGRSGGRGGGESPVAVQTAVARSGDVPITESSVGWVEPIAAVDVRPRVDGVIVEKAVTDGQMVKAGDLLFRLDDKVLQATLAKDQAALARDQANAGQLAADLSRLKTLHTHNDATAQQVEQQSAQVAQAAASVAGDEAQIQSDQVQLGYTTITAPIAGRLGAVTPTIGALVRTSDQAALLSITQMAPLRVSFTVPERDLDALRAALQSGAAKVGVFDPQSGKKRAEGALDFIDSSIDTSSGTVTAKALFPNADGVLWPGEYLKVTAELGVHHDATMVPLAALQVDADGTYVFVAKADGTVATQKVDVADETDDAAILDAGLKPNDHVVIEGQLRLHDGSRIKETVVASNAPADAASGPAELRQ
jgi:multidrug efflux system membrane fusion protein